MTDRGRRASRCSVPVSLFTGAHATIVSVAQGLGALAEASGAARAALPDHVIRTAVARLRESALADAQQLAEAGCREAVDSGLDAEPTTVAAEHSVCGAILQAASEADADAIVCGTRSHGAAVRAVVGSVAAALVHRRAAAGARRARGGPHRFWPDPRRV